MRWADAATPLGVLLALGLAAAPAPARALDLAPQPVTASLWSEFDGIAPGRPLTVGLHLEHAPGWHTYWLVPGDAGLPTSVTWRLPAGVRAGPMQWPVPSRLPTGPLVDYGYQDDTLLLTRLQTAKGLSPGRELHIEARAQWLMCRDVCIPGSQDLELTLPVREVSQLHPTAHAPEFDRARARIPPDLKLAAAKATRNGTRLTLAFAAPAAGVPHHLEFFPLEPSRIEPSAPQTLQVNGKTVLLELTAAQPVGTKFRTLRGVLVADGGPDEGGWFGAINVPLTK